MIIVLLSFFISAMAVAYVLPHILVVSLRKRLIDPIDPRKIHSVPASRLGGVAFFPAILFSVWSCICLTNFLAPYIGHPIEMSDGTIMKDLALLLLFFVGLQDDLIGVAYRSKFLVQIIAAVLVICSGVYISDLHGFLGINEISLYIGIPLTILLYVFITNAINLIDGIDGLASLLSIMALLVYTVMLYLNGISNDCLIAAATLGALVPFCFSNIFGVKKGASSKIFMGDTGALVIGAILGFTAINIWNLSAQAAEQSVTHDKYYILAFTMLIVPCFDVIRIVIHRFLAKKPLFMPDKNHIHHKFMALGYSPRQALLWIILINVIFLVINVFLSYILNFTFIVLIDFVVWTILHIIITKSIRLKKVKIK